MIGYNFTERVRRVLAIAREEALELSHEYVGTEHILLGLLRDGEGVAVATLANLRADHAALRRRVLGILQRGKKKPGTGPDLPYTSRAKKVLELSMAAARELEHNYIGTEHILLGLIREQNGIGAQVLLEAGVTEAAAKGEILRLLGMSTPQSELHPAQMVRLPLAHLIVRDTIKRMLWRDLKALDREIAAYPDDESVWKLAPGIANSAGTLVLHTEGNLRHFIGAVLGKDNYVRNRDAEFSTRDLTRADLRTRIAATITAVMLLEQVGQEELAGTYPVPINNRRVKTMDFLLHLSVHLAYHLGQVDYHRRMFAPSDAKIGAMLPDDLASAD